MTFKRLLALVCVSAVLLAGGSGLLARSSTWNVATGPTWSNVAELRQSIVTQALHAYDVSSQGGNYPSEDLPVLGKLFDPAYAVLIDYSRWVMADFYPEALIKPRDESLDKYQHFQATYHDGPKGNDRVEALRWLTKEPKAGGECVFFANLVAARAGWNGYLRYAPTTDGFTRSDGTKVNPVPAEYGKVQPGDVVMSTPPYRHAAVVVEVAATGVTVVESNYLCTERVGKRVMPWSELAKYAYHVVILDPETPECFGDLAGCRWAAPAIDQLAAQEVIQGVAPNVFNPNGLVTRAQFATLVQRVFALTPPAQPVGFSDVQVGDWRYDPVQAVTPYIPPVTGGRFAPDEPIDRETVASVLAAILGAKGELTLPDANSADMMLTAFYDAASITPARRPAVAAIVDVRIMSGFDDGTFRPRGLLTRAQVAIVLQRVVDLLTDLLSNVPAVSKVAPSSGPQSGGTEVQLAGRRFFAATEVRFGTVPAVDFTVDSDNQITATSPPGTRMVNVTVTNASGTSPMISDDRFTYKSLSGPVVRILLGGVALFNEASDTPPLGYLLGTPLAEGRWKTNAVFKRGEVVKWLRTESTPAPVFSLQPQSSLAYKIETADGTTGWVIAKWGYSDARYTLAERLDSLVDAGKMPEEPAFARIDGKWLSTRHTWWFYDEKRTEVLDLVSEDASGFYGTGTRSDGTTFDIRGAVCGQYVFLRRDGDIVCEGVLTGDTLTGAWTSDNSFVLAFDWTLERMGP